MPCNETRKDYARRKSGAPANERSSHVETPVALRADMREVRDLRDRFAGRTSLQKQIVRELSRRRWIGEVYREIGGSGFAQDLFIDENPSGAGHRVAKSR